MAKDGFVQVDGYDEFRRGVSRAVDRDLPKRLGAAHKEVGQFIIDRLTPPPDPAAIGEGAGATVRPSASKREVLLRVGGTHRAGNSPQAPWGKRRVLRVGAEAPERPYIRGTADANQPQIEQFFLNAVSRAMDPAFYSTEP